MGTAKKTFKTMISLIGMLDNESYTNNGIKQNWLDFQLK